MDTVQDKTYEAIYYSLWSSQAVQQLYAVSGIGKATNADDSDMPVSRDREMPVFSVWPVFRNGWTDDGQAYQGGTGALQNI